LVSVCSLLLSVVLVFVVGIVLEVELLLSVIKSFVLFLLFVLSTVGTVLRVGLLNCLILPVLLLFVALQQLLDLDLLSPI